MVAKIPVLLISCFAETATADSNFTVLQIFASLQNSLYSCDFISDIIAVAAPPQVCFTTLLILHTRGVKALDSCPAHMHLPMFGDETTMKVLDCTLNMLGARLLQL